jgi:sigma-E factor negative regulatory protein RseA
MTAQDFPSSGAAGNRPRQPSDLLLSDHEANSLSAFADGQREACDDALKAWSSSPQARAAWHSLHLARDVLNSAELASSPGHDERFLQAIRGRLALEPAILAPAPAPAASVTAVPIAAPVRARRRSSFWAYGAVAAGFMAVGSVVVVLNGADKASSSASSLAAAGPGAVTATAPSRVAFSADSSAAAVPVSGLASTLSAPGSVSPGLATDPQWRTLDGNVIRDARLDAYLQAHRGHSAVSGRFQTVVLER